LPKNGKFAKIQIFIEKSSYKAKNVPKKNATNFTFLKDPANLNSQKHLQNFMKPKCVYSRENKNLQIPFKGVAVQNSGQNIIAKIVFLLLVKAFQRALKC